MRSFFATPAATIWSIYTAKHDSRLKLRPLCTILRLYLLGGRATPSEADFQFLLNKSHDFITLIGRTYRYEAVNDAYCWAMEKPKEEILGKLVADVWGRERFESQIRGRLDTALGGEEVHYEERFTFGPFERSMRVSMYPYYRDGESPSHVAVFNYDVSRLNDIETKLSNYEFRDPDTGLFNRRSLDVVLDMEIEKAKRYPEQGLGAVLYISLKHLELVVQAHGHHVRDILLENTGIRIRKVLRGSDHVFRYEGSNLVALLDGISRNTDVGPIAQTILNAVSVPYRHGKLDLVLDSVVGVSIYPEDGEDKDELLRNAISAEIEAERTEKPFLFFNTDLHKLAYERMELTSDLKRAFEENRFKVHYHPIVDLYGNIVGAEALLRWTREDGSRVPPGVFIPIAEETGLIASIDKWVLFNVARQVGEWNETTSTYVTINLSASTFTSSDLPALIRGALKSAGDPDPKRIKIEVTESECMNDPEAAIERMKELNEMGIEVWIDDFGTGHSSLSYLRKLPASMMKIDKEFVDELVDSPEDMVYLANIINSIRSRRKDIVVEGVESARQHELLTRLGCSFMQGFYYSKPICPEEFGAMLSEAKPLLHDQT